MHYRPHPTVKALGLLLVINSLVVAQQAPPPAASPAPSIRTAVAMAQSKNAPQQVLSVVHQMTGLEVLRLMEHYGVGTVDNFPNIEDRQIHTRIAAGYALGDGGAIATRLPRTEVESLAQTYSWSVAPPAPAAGSGQNMPPTPRATTAPADQPNLFVLQGNGQKYTARFLGFDEPTQLSFLQVDGLPTAPAATEADLAKLDIDQQVRIVAPEAQRSSRPAADKLLLALGEAKGRITNIVRDPSGEVKALTLALESVAGPRARVVSGGVVLNDHGDMIGMIERNDAATARVLPLTVMRRAADRVRSRKTKPGYPWLGVRGEAIGTTNLSLLQGLGWKRNGAQQILDRQRGVVLTSVPAGSPAAKGQLKAGDVVISVNDEEIGDADDFSKIIGRADADTPLKVKILRPQSMDPTVATVKLGLAANPKLATLELEARERQATGVPLAAFGIDKIDLTGQLAATFGTQGGWLITSVQDESVAQQKGILAGDVIETINGKPATSMNPLLLPTECSFGIRRRDENLTSKTFTIVLSYTTTPQP